jgi:hypothetical protein
MKRLLLGACAALLFLTFGPVPNVSAAWWWHHHSGPGPAGVGADKKLKREKVHHDRHHEQHQALYTAPKSFGWRHATPGPMGFGSGHNESTKMAARHEKHHSEKLASTSHGHHFFAWLHHDHSAPAGAGASTTANGK